MKFRIISLLFCLLSYSFCFSLEHHDHHDHEREPYHFSIRENKHYFSKSYMMEKEHRPFGMIKKSKFHLTSVYDLYDMKGKFEAKGSARIFCLGALYDWGTEIDIYDKNGHHIGVIDGQLGTTERARFSIYNAENGLVGIAYVYHNGTEVMIAHPLYDTYAVAMMNRALAAGVQDHWDVSVYDPVQVDERFLKIFTSFIVDRQNNWLSDDDDD